MRQSGRLCCSKPSPAGILVPAWQLLENSLRCQSKFVVFAASSELFSVQKSQEKPSGFEESVLRYSRFIRSLHERRSLESCAYPVRAWSLVELRRHPSVLRHILDLADILRCLGRALAADTAKAGLRTDSGDYRQRRVDQCLRRADLWLRYGVVCRPVHFHGLRAGDGQACLARPCIAFAQRAPANLR
jgi:hypothetical protein